jgi:hypothetical protein
VDITDASSESIQIKWADAGTYYEVLWIRNEATYFYFVKDGEGRNAECPGLDDSHSEDKDLSVYRIPRSCIPKAPNRITAQGEATLGSVDFDKTKRTPAATRG